MQTILFKQNEIKDPYAEYAAKLTSSPLMYDTEANCWGIYSHELCQLLLNHSDATIPTADDKQLAQLSPKTQAVRSALIRLMNGERHGMARPVVSKLFAAGKPSAPGLDQLRDVQSGDHLDWVKKVALVLPAHSILHRFGFSREDSDLLLTLVPNLVEIMAPMPSEGLDHAVETAYACIETHLEQQGIIHAEDAHLLVSNLIGFLIQSYDAGRGLFSNALLAHFRQGVLPTSPSAYGPYFKQLTLETLRFDPPVQNTKRVLSKEIELGGHGLRAGEQLLLVLAAANRDPALFSEPDQFRLNRPHIESHLTFGSGFHACLAKHLMVDLAAETLATLFTRFEEINLLNIEIDYEPRVNVRLPREIWIEMK